MVSRALYPVDLPALAITHGTTAPAVDQGSQAWSTTLNCVMVYNGTSWQYPVERATIITFVIDGGGAIIAVNQTVDLLDLPAGLTVTGWTISTDASATCSVDIQRATYANFPTFTSIAGTDKPSTTAAQKNQDLVLTGWGATVLAAGDCLRAIVNTNDNAKRITVALRVTWS